MKRTYQPSKLIKKEDMALDLEMSTKGGRKLLARRRQRVVKTITLFFT